jgi:hypothetical protein
MPRPNPLADDDFAQKVAEAFADGCGRKKMCEMFGVRDPDTITRWRRNPKVKALTFKLIEDRVLQVTRKVDGKIAAILERDDLTVSELLAIRKEFLGGALREQTQKVDDETVAEAHELLANDPDLADKLDELLTKGHMMPDEVTAVANED